MDQLPHTIFHIDDAPSWRGGEQQVLYLHQGLLADGHDSRVICQQGGAFQQRLREEELPHYAIRMVGGHDPGAAWRLRRLAARPGTILHTHTSHAHDLGLWARRLGARGKLVVSRRVDFPVGRSWASRRKYLDHRVDRYLAISSAVEWELGQAGVDPGRMRRVPDGIDLTRFVDVEPDRGWRMQFDLQPGELLFCNVAALAPHKDQATLLRAFRRFRDAGGQGKLVILGEGELRSDLERQQRQLGLDSDVFLPGFAREILPKISAADVFVMSSSTEGLGSSILDAMALGRPVASTAAGGIVDAVDHEETGLLVPPGDAAALAVALKDLQESAVTRQRMGLAGQRKVEQFDVRRLVDLTLAAYRELFSAHND